MEENQHHSDLKYFDFLHYTSDTNNDSNDNGKPGLFGAPTEKMAAKHTSNGDGGNAYNDRYDDKDIDELDGRNELAMYERRSQQATQRMGYDEPEYATVDLKKKNDDRLKSNGLITGGSNIMGE
jgi:hypothetical protein